MYTYNREDVVIDLDIPISQQWMIIKAINTHKDLINAKINEALEEYKVPLDVLNNVAIIFNWIDLNKNFETFETSSGNCVVLILISWTKDGFPSNAAIKLKFKLENMKLTLI